MRRVLVVAVILTVTVGIWTTLRDDRGARHDPIRSVDTVAPQRDESTANTETNVSRGDAAKNDPWERLPRANVLPVRVRVDGPEGIIDELELEEHRDGEWRVPSPSFTLGDDERTFDVPPGRYRLVLVGTRAVLREFTVAGAVELDLDLTGVERLRIHVDTPASYFAGHISVWAIDGEREHALPRLPGKPFPHFEVLLPGDRPCRFEPRHPLLRGAARETDRGGSLTLRMDPGPLLRFTLARGSPGSVYTTWFRPGDVERPMHGGTAVRCEDDTYGFTGWTPGTYDVLFHLPKHIPVLRRMTIPAEGLDVGELPQERGSWVRLKSTKRYRRARIESLTMPRISRRPRGGIIKGLAAGRYALRYVIDLESTELEIAVNGVDDVELDLR